MLWYTRRPASHPIIALSLLTWLCRLEGSGCQRLVTQVKLQGHADDELLKWPYKFEGSQCQRLVTQVKLQGHAKDGENFSKLRKSFVQSARSSHEINMENLARLAEQEIGI